MRRLPVGVLLLALLTAAVAVPVAAQPSSDEVEAELDDAQARMDDLQLELGTAAERLNEAEADLEEATTELAATRGRIDGLRDEVDALSDQAASFARRLHKLGPTMELSAVMTAASGDDVGARTTALQHILDGQHADLEGLAAARERLATEERRLVEQREAAEEHRERMAAQREELAALEDEHRDEIDELEAELAEAEDREEREAAIEAQREAAQRAAERGDAGDADEPGGSTDADDADETSDGGSSSAPSAPAPGARQSASVAVDTAMAQVGKPYQWGGSGPNSFDCSGLTSYAWRAAGVELPRTSQSQYHGTTRVSRSQLQAGDLVFYSSNGAPSGIGHVAMYTGSGGSVVEAPYTGANVRVRGDGLSRSDILGYGRP